MGLQSFHSACFHQTLFSVKEAILYKCVWHDMRWMNCWPSKKIKCQWEQRSQYAGGFLKRYFLILLCAVFVQVKVIDKRN